ncbi:MAG: hypothetical protein M4579_004164 [Chaenotheca gracillima]|nr:MAG: hypothetical protein M4579_004164 [Chaenotheca gracillima]
MKAKKARKIVFFHPDLGIGGAERLVIDAAVGLQNLGHKVTIFTSHCDPNHCFDEARNGTSFLLQLRATTEDTIRNELTLPLALPGTLDVRVRGNSVVPPNVLGRFAILCAILRQLHLVIQISFSGELRNLRPDVFFIDQLSACIPLLRLVQPTPRTLFYCHFPDQLLASRKSWVKRLYRLPFDRLEEWSTGAADTLAVNSEFTQRMFGRTFPGLKDRQPSVVYPCVDVKVDSTWEDTKEGDEGSLWRGKKVVLSINRFERKKTIEIAVKAYAGLSEKTRKGVRLVVAGGYDPRVHENVAYLEELEQLARSLDLKVATTKTIVTALNVPEDIEVLFFLSVPGSLKSMLLRAARLLVYTPTNEHFGIVPLEAMLAGVPVLAANTGGPLETVVDGRTGWLRDIEKVEDWTKVMDHALNGISNAELRQMKDRGRKRVVEQFSDAKLAERLDAEIGVMMTLPRKNMVSLAALGILISLLGILGALVGVVIYRYSAT